MSELFYIYREAFVLLAIAGALLPLMGVHLLARDRVLESYGLTQAAVLGHLLGQLLIHMQGWGEMWGGQFIFGIVAIFSCYLFFQLTSKWFERQKSSYYFCMGLIFMGLTYGLSTYFPFLEGQMARSYMGDIVTASSSEILLAAIIFIFGIFVHAFFFFSWRKDTLNIALFGKEFSPKQTNSLLFNLATLTILSVSIMILGHLYTLGALLILPLLLNPLSIPFRAYVFLCISLTMLASLFGPSLSLYWPRVSTVPAFIIVLASLGGLVSFLCVGFLSIRNYRKVSF